MAWFLGKSENFLKTPSMSFSWQTKIREVGSRMASTTTVSNYLYHVNALKNGNEGSGMS